MASVAIKNGSVLVDDLDLDWAMSRPWHLSDTGYAKCYSGAAGGTPLRMHRLVMERVLGRPLTKSELVDHINRDRLDNRRENLRIVSHSQNGMNSNPRAGKSNYKGVGHKADRPFKCWMAYINREGKRWYIGNFYDELEAAWMHDQFALALHGEYASLNFDYVKVGDA